MKDEPTGGSERARASEAPATEREPLPWWSSEDPASIPRALLGESPPMRHVRNAAALLAKWSGPVLIRGESGTGKTLMARWLHAASPGPGPLVRVRCDAIPGGDSALGSETLAAPLEAARGGTLVLEEMGSAPPEIQGAVADLLETDCTVRLIATSQRDLETLVRQRQLESPFYGTFAAGTLWMPPLRVRLSDVPILARSFCEAVATACGRDSLTFDPGALDVLRSQRWPGNVRQLRDVVERLVLLSPGPTITPMDARGELQTVVRFIADATTRTRRGLELLAGRSFAVEPSVRADAERRALEHALSHARGNPLLAARILKLPVRRLREKLQEHGIGR